MKKIIKKIKNDIKQTKEDIELNEVEKIIKRKS